MVNFRSIIIAITLLLGVLFLPACLPSYAAQQAPAARGASASDVKNVQSELGKILAAPEYNRVYHKGLLEKYTPKWIKKFMEKLGEMFTYFVKWLRNALTFHGAATAGKLASFVFACIVIIAFIIILVIVVRKLLRMSFRKIEPEDQPDIFDYDLPSAKPLITEAAKLAEAGDYRGAFRCAYLASISYLDEIEALRFERSRTNWEYLRELQHGGKDTSYKELKPLTLDFDRMFYGNSKCGVQDYKNALDAYNRITSEALQ